eukprot:1623217-Prymnesium_polylepis.1
MQALVLCGVCCSLSLLASRDAHPHGKLQFHRQPSGALPRMSELPQVDDDTEEYEDGRESPIYLRGLIEWESPADLALRIMLSLGFMYAASRSRH